MSKHKIIFCCFVFVQLLFSQEFDPYSLFPHHEGDVWEYLFLNEDPPVRQQSQILSDTIVNGDTYIKTIYRELDYDNEFNVDYLIDTSYNVWRNDSTWHCCDLFILYKLNAEQNESWIMNEYENNYFEIGVFDSTYTGVFWGDSVTFASFSYYIATDTADYSTWFWYTSNILATNFGLVRTYAEGTGGTVLIGAVLDGILWGDTTYLSIVNDYPKLPARISLTNYPNPFNPSTTLRYDLPEESIVVLKIYDLMGREIKTLVNGTENAGFKKIMWDSKNNFGDYVPSGLYFFRIDAFSEESEKQLHETRKMVLMK